MTAEERAEMITPCKCDDGKRDPVSHYWFCLAPMRKWIAEQIRQAERLARERTLEDAANHLVNSAAGFHCPSRELLGHFKLAEDHIRALMENPND